MHMSVCICAIKMDISTDARELSHFLELELQSDMSARCQNPDPFQESQCC